MVGEDEHITSDLGEAAYLSLILGFPDEFDRRTPSRVYFIFRGDKEFMEMKSMDYQEGRAKVDAKSMSEMIKSLKRTVSTTRTVK